MNNQVTITIKQAQKILAAAIQVDQPCLFLGQPGLGKTDIVNAVWAVLHDKAGMFPGGCYVWSTTENNALDKGGLYAVENGKTVRVPVAEVDWDKPVLILVDEFSDAPLHEQSGWYRLVKERELGNHKLAAGSYVCAAGNRPEDQAAAREISSALKGRCQCYTLRADHKSVLEYAYAHNWDTKLIGFLNAYGLDFIDNGFNADAPYAGSTPRDFARLAAMEQAGCLSDPELELAQIVSCIDHEAGYKYHAFRQLDVPNPELVFIDPETAPIPESIDVLWAYCAAIIAKADDSNKAGQAILAYGKRIGRTHGAGLAWDWKAKHSKKVITRACWADIVCEYAELAE